MNDIVPAIPETEPLPPTEMVVIHTAYFDINGKLLIISSGGVMQPPDNAVYSQEVDDPTNFNIYYDTEAKPKMAFALTVTRNKIEGIPVGTTAFMDDGVEVINDGSIEFVVNYEGEAGVFLEHPYYISQAVIVEVGP